MDENTVMLLAGIGILAMFCQWVAWRLRLPAILFLLLAGLAVGPGAGWLDPDSPFAHLLFPFISLSVAVILLECSLPTPFTEIRRLTQVVRRLITPRLRLTLTLNTIPAQNVKQS